MVFRKPPLGLWILRTLFIVASFGVGFSVVTEASILRLQRPAMVYLAVVLGAMLLLAIDVFTPRKRIEWITCVFFGLLVGLFLTWLLLLAVEPLLPTEYLPVVRMTLGVCFSYSCISLLIQTRDDFRFIIPYVEFAKELRGARPYILDTSVVIDGRIADLAETNIVDNQLIMPRFVLNELQAIADSGDRLKRTRGRRGLDILNRLRSDDRIDLQIYEQEHPEWENEPVDMRLVLLAKRLEGKVITGDYNLNKVARIHNVSVINLNDVANALKPVFLPGESFAVKIVKPGEGVGQGVGYLDDGTMIVVEGGREHLQRTVDVTVTSVLQKSAGRMIFAKFERAK